MFITAGDPVQQDLAASLNRPDANVTGLTMMNTALTRKQMELMSELLGGSAPIAVLSDPNIEGEDLAINAERASQNLGQRIAIVNAASENDFEAVLARIAEIRVAGLVVPDRPLFTSRHDQLAKLISRYRIPTIYPPQIWRPRVD